ncbi:MAG: metal-dependent hydrolase [Methanomicrobiales archaeon]|nr:metal-dependent hydrolase [Methanomicrobiales archaeon]
MRLEHLFFNLAVAIVVGMAYRRMTGRDPSVIIVLAAFLPDLNVVVHAGVHLLAWISGITILFYHGSFHNILALAAISFGVAFVASRFGIRFRDAGLCTAIGYGTHLVCDAVAFNDVSLLLWPLVPATTVPVPYWYNPNFLHIAQGSVLAVAVTLVLLAALVRTYVEGRGWIRNYTHPQFT